MKRSEAQQYLENILNSLASLNTVDKRLIPGIASCMLTATELLGMQPPTFIARVATGKKYNPEIDFAADTYMAKGWEPE